MKAISTLLFVVLVGCATDPDALSTAYFPLEAGNWWKYVRTDDSAAESTYRVGEKRIVNGRQYSQIHIERIVSPRLGQAGLSTAYVRSDDDGRVYALIDTADVDEYVMIDPAQFDGYTEENQSPVADRTYHTDTVPAGTFRYCIRVSAKYGTFDGYAETYAPGVGCIKMHWFQFAEVLTEANVRGEHYP